jgi:pyridoxamine 5'-phosphate oxidase
MDLRGRTDYAKATLDEADVGDDPIAEARRWLAEAVAAGIHEPNAMTLATVGSDGRPSARIVLLREIDARGLTFFTNYQSKKGRDLDGSGVAALLFFWPQLERQIRVEGKVERVPVEESDAYFATRPRPSQLGAWASEQSEVLTSRQALDERFAEIEATFADRPVERPQHWGGYRLRPSMIELWQGRPSRLHDRLRWRLDGAVWVRERLSP